MRQSRFGLNTGIRSDAEEKCYIQKSKAPRTIDPRAPIAGIESIDEEFFVDGAWVPRRRLNGDENSQGSPYGYTPKTSRKAKFIGYGSTAIANICSVVEKSGGQRRDRSFHGGAVSVS